MSIGGRLDWLQKHAPAPRRVLIVAADCPPDGHTRLLYDDGTETRLPPGAPVPEGHGAQTIVGIDPDLVVGVRTEEV